MGVVEKTAVEPALLVRLAGVETNRGVTSAQEVPTRISSENMSAGWTVVVPRRKKIKLAIGVVSATPVCVNVVAGALGSPKVAELGFNHKEATSSDVVPVLNWRLATTKIVVLMEKTVGLQAGVPVAFLMPRLKFPGDPEMERIIKQAVTTEGVVP